MENLSKNKLREILNKGWMTHDGMWFYHCLQECGIEKTNKINKSAVKSMSLIEINRLMKFFNVKSVKTFEELKKLINNIFQVVKADFMKFYYDFPRDNEISFKMENCFAYNGVKRIGVEEAYICGIYDRIDGWFEGIGLNFTAYPEIKNCLIREQHKCERTYKFVF